MRRLKESKWQFSSMTAPRLLQRCAVLLYRAMPVRLLGPLPRLPVVRSCSWGVAGRGMSLQHGQWGNSTTGQSPRDVAVSTVARAGGHARDATQCSDSACARSKGTTNCFGVG